MSMERSPPPLKHPPVARRGEEGTAPSRRTERDAMETAPETATRPREDERERGEVEDRLRSPEG